jgi:hypothetical protein
VDATHGRRNDMPHCLHHGPLKGSYMSRRLRAVLPLLVSMVIVPVHAAALPQDGEAMPGAGHPGCDGLDAKACVELAIRAMGGRERLAGIHSARYGIASNTVLAEQSSRQQPFVTSYEQATLTVDFDKQRLLRDEHVTWPIDDPHAEHFDRILVATPQGGVRRGKQGDSPASPADLDNARDTLALGPERLLLNASAASDLRYAPTEWLRATPHTVVTFTWQGKPVSVLLNARNHLPDALERVRTFEDFWLAWGDVQQRIYFDNWYIVQGVVFPTNRIDQRNGLVYTSYQFLDPVFNSGIDDKSFAMDPAAAAASAQSKGMNSPFNAKDRVALAPGIELYQGDWNTTLVKQDDGVLIVEAPISTNYVRGILAKAHEEYPGVPVKAALNTSDSWPHIAGVRQIVAAGAPVYILDLNRPLLDRLVQAPHRLQPDDLQMHPKPAHWITVGDRVVVGQGANQAVLYPLRGASTERQYMVYFPQRKLLYASDTLGLTPEKSLFDPDMMYEVAEAVAREHLDVDTVYSMHQGPVPWAEVQRLVSQAASPDGKSGG